ncbi:MAG: helix-turn-helix transcriptional regulator, partial [Candidatus Micrarchaeota archaeon]|nr:helix-turn-helix transcriptional regulator [Candidatus Micrarchaeota archaeon]
MGKHGSTKTKILKLISQGDNTLSGISKALDMSPSTVSKHIHDLQVSGAIEQQENEHIKKWKYYRVSGTEQNNNPDWTLWRRSDRAMQITAIMGLLIIGALTYAFTAYNSGGAYIPISITDPPAVPPGTQALFINYSSLSIYVHNAGTSEWLPINASGRLNLMSLINESQVIGGVTLPAGAKISYAKFNITSASIVIGNTTYPVHLIGSAVTATVENNSKLNSSSGILLDFAPVVGNIYAQNSSYFIMLPSLRAVIVSDHNVEFGQVGRVSQSQQQLMPKYAEMFSATNPSIGIRNATMQLNGNSVAFSITLNNTSPENITIMGVWLRTFGKFNYSGIGAENRNITVNGSGFYLYRAWGMGMGRQGINDSSQMGFIIYKRMGNSTNIEINDSAVQQLGYMGT